MNGTDAPSGDDETNKVWYLKQNRLFEETPEDDVERFAELFTMITLPRKALVFDQSDPSRSIYLIKRGTIRIARLTPDGKELTVAILGKGDLFGEEALFADRPRTTFAIVVDEALLCVSRADQLMALLGTEPKLALNVAGLMSERLIELTSAAEDIAYARLSDRLVHLLERLAIEHGKPCDGGIELTIRLTHADIASLVGSTRETVSLELARLIKSGRLKQRGQALVIPAKAS